MFINNNSKIIGLGIQNSKPSDLLRIFQDLGGNVRESTHDDKESHIVADFDSLHIEFFSEDASENEMVIMIEVDNIDEYISSITEDYKSIYKKKTTLPQYKTVTSLMHSSGVELRLYEK